MTRFDAADRGPLWISGQLGCADLTTSPQAQQHQQKRSIHVLHKPDNLISYRQSRDVGAYLGLTSRRHQSGEVDDSGRISKYGDSLLRSLLYEAAHSLAERCPQVPSLEGLALKDWARRLRKRSSHKTASRGPGAQVGGDPAPDAGHRRSFSMAAKGGRRLDISEHTQPRVPRTSGPFVPSRDDGQGDPASLVARRALHRHCVLYLGRPKPKGTMMKHPAQTPETTSETTVFPAKDEEGSEELDRRAGIRQPNLDDKDPSHGAYPPSG